MNLIFQFLAVHKCTCIIQCCLSDIGQGLYCEESLMGSHGNIWEGQQTLDGGSRENAAGHILVYISRFFFINIQTNSKEFMVTDSCNKIIGFDQSASGSVDQDHAVFHFCNSFRIDQMLCLRSHRTVKADQITGCKKFVQ